MGFDMYYLMRREMQRKKERRKASRCILIVNYISNSAKGEYAK